ncbi:MAG: hypothetical protein QOE69_2680 [Thermoleophilaceae bacterium]|nr:hypothetical protein [Thermoleophilaceae bacterium]MEA2408561.1 hypothetical protein [Thermoleophilaceae bacterium]
MKRPLLALPLVLLAASGCGSSDAAPAVDESDTPGVALACLQEQGIEATRTGEKDNELVLDAGPKIKFYLTAAEAEAAQFQGNGEGAEQIGSALLFIDPELDQETEDILHDVEVCLADL